MEIQYLNITISENNADHTNVIVENINNPISLSVPFQILPNGILPHLFLHHVNQMWCSDIL